MENGAVWVFVIIAIAFYFIPTFVAMNRDHRQAGAIAVLNLLLGWTLVGWVAALVWAATATSPASPVTVAAPASEAPAPNDLAANLQRYADLRDKGILTEAEFEGIKARLLGDGDA